MSVEVTGLDEVMKNLNKEIGKIGGDVGKGLDSAGQFIKLEAMSRAPQDTGNLKDTAFKKSDNTINGPVETIGFTADYAPYVHESKEKWKGLPRLRKGAKGHYWDQGESHFLEKAVLENFSNIINIISKFASKG